MSRRRRKRSTETSTTTSTALKKSNSANKHLGLTVLLNPEVDLYENDEFIETAMDNYHGFRVRS